MSLGKKVRKLRQAAKISLRQLSEAVEVSPSQLSRIERDMDSPRANTLLRIADFFDVKMEQLLVETVIVPRDYVALAETGIATILEDLEQRYPARVTEIKLVRAEQGNHLVNVFILYEEK